MSERTPGPDDLQALREKEQQLTSLHDELATMANLYIATYQLHSTLKLPILVRHLRELLAQLVGAEAYAYYFVDEPAKTLAPIFSEGIDALDLPTIRIEEMSTAAAGAAAIARAFTSGESLLRETDITRGSLADPVACVPLRIDDRVVGVVVVVSMLAHKERLAAVDRELFKLLGAHAAPALSAALLYAAANEELPSVHAFRGIEGPISARTIPPEKLRR